MTFIIENMLNNKRACHHHGPNNDSPIIVARDEMEDIKEYNDIII